MRLRQVPHWPPPWGSAYKGLDKFATGDEGTLRSVEWNWERTPENKYLTVTIEYEGRPHSGVLPGDQKLLERVHRFLAQHIGRPVAELGDLELPE
jgi:hypothetical protein